MKTILNLLSLILLLLHFTSLSAGNIVRDIENKKPVNILVVVGGTKPYPDSFLDIFFSSTGINVDTLSQPRANEALLSGAIKKYKAIVFYDMNQNITELQKSRFIGLTKRGTGLIFLHHSLVSYQEWDEFKKIVGGKYYEKRFNYPPELISDYKHDIILDVKLLKPDHPVTRGINDFVIMDEGYSNIEILPGVTPLLAAQHPDCSEIIAWTNIYNKSRIVYLLLGHDEHAYYNDNYRKLIMNSIYWSIQK